MTKELSESEANKLFNTYSSAVRDNDVEKMDTLNEKEEDTEKEDEPLEEEDSEDTPNQDTDDGKEEESPDDEDEKEEKAPADEDEPEPKDDDDTKEAPEAKKKEDGLAELKEQLEKISKENHHLRSQAGRVPNVQRRLKELDAKLEELTKAHTSPSSQPSTKIKPKMLEKLAKIKETDPELADIIAEVMGDATDGVAQELRSAEIESVKALRESQFEEYRQGEVDRLLEMYPNAPEVFQSPSWSTWKEKQSQQIQRLAGSDNADDVSFVFQQYAADMVKQHPELASTEAKPESSDPEAAEKAKKLEAERRRKKENTAVVGSPNMANKAKAPENAESLFKKYSEEIRKERSG